MTGSSPPPVIEIRDLGHRFPGGTYGIRNINISFRKGEFVVIAGRNGSGKTLLARHMVGLVHPTEGEILFKGFPLKKQLGEVRAKIGLVFQDADNQIVGGSIEDDLRFGPENAKLPEEEIRHRTAEVIALLGLTGRLEVAPPRLSGGEKRRLAIGGILAMDPEILVLDEPFANLDYPGVVDVLRILVDLQNRGHGIILITHELEKALAHADRLIIMAEGRIVEDGPAEATAPQAGAYGLHPLNFQGHSLREYTWLP
jgi:biotin transport system ATP-binding protein